MKDIQFLSILMAERYLRHHKGENLAVISMVTPGSENIVKESFGHLPNFLECVFYDISLIEYPEAEIDGFKCFDESMALEIIEFVERVKDSVDEIVVHCEAGVSRSSAVAKFISDAYFPDIQVKTYGVYNRYVHSLLEKVKNGNIA